MSEEAVMDEPFTMEAQGADLLKEFLDDQGVDDAMADVDDNAEEAPPKKEEPKKEPKQEEEETPKDEEKEESKDVEDKEEEETLELDDDFGFDGEEKEVEEVEGFDEEAFDKETKEKTEELKLDEAQAKAFASQRREIKQLKQGLGDSRKVEELETKIKDYEAKVAKLNELEEQVDNLRTSDYRLKVEASPEYKREITRPVEQITKMINKTADDYNIDANIIANTVRAEPGKAMDDRLEALSKAGLPRTAIDRITHAANQYQDTVARKQEMLEHAKEEYKRIEDERLAESQKQAEQRRSLVAKQRENLRGKLAKSLPEMFGDDSPVSQDLAKAERQEVDFADLSAENEGYADFAGRHFNSLLKFAKWQQRELQRLGKGEKASSDASPDLSKGSGDGQEKKDEPTTLAEIMAEAEATGEI